MFVTIHICFVSGYMSTCLVVCFQLYTVIFFFFRRVLSTQNCHLAYSAVARDVSSSKSVEQSANFEKYTFEKINKFLTKFDPISGLPIAFLQATAKIDNEDTLKVCRKITKITDLNLGFFLGNGGIFQQEVPVRTFKIIDIFDH